MGRQTDRQTNEQASRQASRQVGRYIDKPTANLPAPVDDDACIASLAKDQKKIPISDAVKAKRCAKLTWGLCVLGLCVFGWFCISVLLQNYIRLLYCNIG